MNIKANVTSLPNVLQKENKQTSNLFWDKKNFCYFILSIIVISKHALGTTFYEDEIPISDIHYYLKHLRTSFTTVPLYFIISPILFFRNISNFKQCKEKTISHLKNLIIPFIIWNIIGFIFNVLIFNIPFIAKYIALRPNVDFSFKTLIDAIIFYKYNPVFWFMAKLIIFTALTPILYFILKDVRIAFISLIVLTIPVMLNISIIPYDFNFIYYFVGAIVGKHFFTHFSKIHSMKNSILATIAYLAIIFIISITSNINIKVILTILSSIFFWIAIDIFKPFYSNQKMSFISCSFFVYAIHYYIEPCFSKIFLISLPMNITSMYINNILSALLTIVSAYFIAYIFMKYIPWLYYRYLTLSKRKK